MYRFISAHRTGHFDFALAARHAQNGAAVGAAEILVRFAVTVLVFLQLKEVLGLGDQVQIALALPTACGKIARE